MGLGDKVENLFQITGVDKLAKAIIGDDCNCEERKAFLNSLYSGGKFKVVNCLNTENQKWIDDFFDNYKNTISVKQQKKIIEIMNLTFAGVFQFSTCTSCWKRYIKEIQKLQTKL